MTNRARDTILLMACVLLPVASACRSAGPVAFAPSPVSQQWRVRAPAQPSIVPTTRFVPSTATPTLTPTSSHTPTPGHTALPPTAIEATLLREMQAPTWTPPPLNPASLLADHYRLARPIASGATNWVDRTYPYGGTAGGRLPIHHGVEFVNARGTPVLAAASGSVHFAGDDATAQFGPRMDYYGNMVVLRHDFNTPQGQPVFTLYGHLESVAVRAGQRVERGATLGAVGDSGIAVGPHLHFELRVGDATDFGATRNPELWIYPYRSYGTLAGRVTDAAGNPLREVTLHVRSTDILRLIWSYAGDSVNSDVAFGENFVLGDLPANYYEITVSDAGRIAFRQTVYVHPGRTTWLETRLRP